MYTSQSYYRTITVNVKFETSNKRPKMWIQHDQKSSQGSQTELLQWDLVPRSRVGFKLKCNW